AGAGQPAAVPEWPGQPLKEHAAGNLQALAGDPAIAFFQQQGYGGADVVGQADTPQRGIAGDESIDLLVVAYDAATEIGLDGAWCQDVHANAVRAQFLGLVAGQYLHRPLHGGVGGIAGQGETCQAAGDVDDAATVGQQRQQALGQEERPFELDVQ